MSLNKILNMYLQYEQFLMCMERLAAHPYSSKEKEFILKFSVPLVAQTLAMEIPQVMKILYKISFVIETCILLTYLLYYSSSMMKTNGHTWMPLVGQHGEFFSHSIIFCQTIYFFQLLKVIAKELWPV